VHYSKHGDIGLACPALLQAHMGSGERTTVSRVWDVLYVQRTYIRVVFGKILLIIEFGSPGWGKPGKRSPISPSY